MLQDVLLTSVIFLSVLECVKLLDPFDLGHEVDVLAKNCGNNIHDEIVHASNISKEI